MLCGAGRWDLLQELVGFGGSKLVNSFISRGVKRSVTLALRTTRISYLFNVRFTFMISFYLNAVASLVTSEKTSPSNLSLATLRLLVERTELPLTRASKKPSSRATVRARYP